jgi:uncharacterized membrane protein
MTDPNTPNPRIPAAPEPVGAPRWMRLALVASLAVNLAVAGLVGGAVLSHRKDRADRRDGIDMSIGALPQALSREDRAALRDVMHARRAERRAAAIADMTALAAALRADPYDASAVQAVFDRQVGRLSEGLQSGQVVMAQRFIAMTPAERAAVADRLDAIAANPRKAAGKGGGGSDR